MCKEQALNSFRIPIVWECDPNGGDWDCESPVLRLFWGSFGDGNDGFVLF
jgi:hypothetical protein